MTISSETRRAGPFNGNDVNTSFPFGFKVFDKTDVKVLRADSSGVSTALVLDSDYSVALNANQDSSPGGTITYPISGTPLPTGYTMVILGALPYLQPTDITNQGGFYPQVIEDMVDRATIQIQQLEENLSRAIVVTEAESTSPVLPNASARANMLLGFDPNGNVTMMPISASVGAGDLKNEFWKDGTDYTSGTSMSVTLSRTYGTKANLGTVVMGGVAQSPDTYSLTGNTLTFLDDSGNPTPIPAGVPKIWCVGGTTLSIYLPPPGSVGPDQLTPGAINDANLPWAGLLERVAASVAAVRALSKTRYSVARTMGYSGAGTPGPASYYLDPSDTTSADDGGSVLVNPTDGGRWKLFDAGTITPDKFGAVGDGVTDDLPAFNRAVAYLLQIGGGTLLIPAKTYYLSNELLISNGNVEVRGVSRHNSRLLFDVNAVNGIHFSLAASGAGTDYQNANVYHLTLLTMNTSAAAPAPGKRAIFYEPSNSQQGSPYPTVNINGLEIRGSNPFSQFWQTGIHLQNACNAMVNDCNISGHFNFQDMYYGLLADKFAVNVQATNCVFNYMATGCEMFSNETVTPPGGVLGCEGLQVIGCQFGGVQRGVVKDNGTTPDPRPLTLVVGCHINSTQNCVQVSNCTETVITGNLFYVQDTVNYTVAAGAACVYMANPNGTTVNRHVVSGNIMRTLAAQPQVRGISCDLGMVAIASNVFSGFDIGIILGSHSNSVALGPCAFEGITNHQIQNAGANNWYSAKTPMASGSSFDIY